MPLTTTFQASKKSGNEHWMKPVIDHVAKTISFEVQNHSEGVPAKGTVNRNGATCVACGSTVPLEYVREQARAGNMGELMTAVVAEGNRKRLFLSPTDEHIRATLPSEPPRRPNGSLSQQASDFRIQRYGFIEWHQLFTERQLLALTTFTNLLMEVGEMVMKYGGDTNYANAVRTYIALAIGKIANASSKFNRWRNSLHFVEGVFTRQAI